MCAKWSNGVYRIWHNHKRTQLDTLQLGSMARASDSGSRGGRHHLERSWFRLHFVVCTSLLLKHLLTGWVFKLTSSCTMCIIVCATTFTPSLWSLYFFVSVHQKLDLLLLFLFGTWKSYFLIKMYVFNIHETSHFRHAGLYWYLNLGYQFSN